MKDIYVVLANGRVFTGKSFGYEAESVGEIVFNTGMVGYNLTLTDPNYYGQIVCQTFPGMGNYGVIPQDFQSDKSVVKGYVVREFCAAPSNFRSGGTLREFLVDSKIPAVCGVDTRALTEAIRDGGVMNAAICFEPDKVDFDALKAYTISGAVDAVGHGPVKVCSMPDSKVKLALVNYGVKRSLLQTAAQSGCEITVFDCDTSAEKLLGGGFDGVVLSGGPGNPADNAARVGQIEKLLGAIPIMGVGLGHQLLALAAGSTTEKLKYGHRGANQPVTDLATGYTLITAQNHGYAVVGDSVKKGTVRFVNANDGSCEGIDYPDLRAFSTQFEPEAECGPRRDTLCLFKRFCRIIGGEENA